MVDFWLFPYISDLRKRPDSLRQRLTLSASGHWPCVTSSSPNQGMFTQSCGPTSLLPFLIIVTLFLLKLWAYSSLNIIPFLDELLKMYTNMHVSVQLLDFFFCRCHCLIYEDGRFPFCASQSGHPWFVIVWNSETVLHTFTKKNIWPLINEWQAWSKGSSIVSEDLYRETRTSGSSCVQLLTRND